MLGEWRCHSEYRQYLVENILPFYTAKKASVEYHEIALSKLYILNLDILKIELEPYYSHTGKPSKNQPEIFRSFVLASELGYHSIPQWVAKLKSEDLLCHMIGVSPSDVPSVSSHYDFINRLWLENPDIVEERRDSLHPFLRKPRKKLSKNQKQPPRHPGIIQKFVDLALQDKEFESRPERLLQQIFAHCCVIPSANEGILGDTSKLAISGDGICIKTGGSPYGIKVCDCIEKGIYNCTCHRKFSDPEARHGWDSHNEVWFYGHCGYFLSVYNPDVKTDIPIYLRLVQAQRYDGVSAIVALAEARKLYPEFTFDKFIGDGAHDNYPTYQLLNEWDIKAVIPLNEKNKGNTKYPAPIALDKNGAPICIAGHSMIFVEFQKDRCRLKYRCPYALGKIDSCSCKEQCSPSDYGRTIYTKPKWDLRLFTAIPRGSDQWKDNMKKRTSSERVNDRILHDYGLEQSGVKGKKRISFRTMIHSFNVHLDSRLKKSGFSFLSILKELLSSAA